MIAASLLCLAMAVQRESGGEQESVQVAVTHTIRNRVKEKNKSVCTVVKAKCQFRLLHKLPREEVINLAKKAWRQKDTTNGATHFHDQRKYPTWAMKMHRTKRIGSLIFYRK